MICSKKGKSISYCIQNFNVTIAFYIYKIACVAQTIHKVSKFSNYKKSRHCLKGQNRTKGEY